MKTNEIVKKDWLPFRVKAMREMPAMAAVILSGKMTPSSPSLSPSERAFLEEKSIQVSGNPARLLHALSSLEETPGEKEIWEERLFLRGFAYSRLGKEAAAGADFSRLPARFLPRIQTERALAFLNRGALPEAEALFREAHRAAAGLDPFSACTLLGGLSLALIHQGEFKEAQHFLKERRAVLREHPSPPLQFGTLLYEILLALEQNDFTVAERLLRPALAEVNLESVNGFFLLHLKLRLALARNELDSAAALVKDLQAIIRALKLPEGVLDLRVEEIELHLRRRRPAQAREIIVPLLAHAQDKRDDHLRFRLTLLLALTLWQEGETAAAVLEAEKAIALGEAKHYRPLLSWAFFHAAGIALEAGQPLRAKLFLHRGRRLAEELRHRVRLAAFSYILEVLENRYASASSLVSLAKHQEIGPELEYFLSAYHILGSVAVQVRQGSHQEVISEPHLRQKLFREPGIFWFQREGVLIANRGKGQVHHLDFSGQDLQLLLFRLFWNALEEKRGLRLEDVHHARLTTPFREHLHAGAAKMSISRLRAQLASCGLPLEYSRTSGRYTLSPASPAYAIQSVAPPKAAPEAMNRENEILQRVAMESFVSTKTLCQEFGVSRQALHPTLKRLCAEGKLKLVRRGPISGYLPKLAP